MAKNFETEILERLDLILKILSLQVAQDSSLTERARILKRAGLSNLQIAEVLNISPASVRTLTSNLNRRER